MGYYCYCYWWCLLFLCWFSFLFARNLPQTPNFVILLADDMGYADVGCWGHPTIYTPNIDQLAREGKRFTQYYTGENICTPSRASLLTGRYALRTGVWTDMIWPLDLIFRVFFPWSTGGLPASEITIPKALKAKNYTSAIIGKWHLGHYNGSLPHQNGGFDYFYGLPYSQDEGCPPGIGFPCSDINFLWPGVPLYQNDKIIQQPLNLETLTDRYNQEALGFIEKSTKAKQPFFLYMAYDQVHIPLFASPRFQNTSRRGLYGDAAQEMDNSIGLIMKKIKDLGIGENTFVFFTSDNGPWLNQAVDGGSAGLFTGGKGSTYEGGVREPAIAWWPGVVKPSTVTMEVTSTIDLFSTFLDLAGIPLPNDRVIDGVSMVPILTDDDAGPIRDFFFYYRSDWLMAVRYKQYKAVFWTESGFGVDPPVRHDPPLLYNIEVDPSEQYPLDVTKYEYEHILMIINAEVLKHNQNMVKGPVQLNAQNVDVAPCCDPSTKCYCGN